MTDLAILFKQEGKQERDVEIATKLLAKDFSMEFVAEITGLDESAIEKLQDEISNG